MRPVPAPFILTHLNQSKNPVSDIIQRLISARDRTLPYFDLDDARLDMSYGPGKWSVRYILHHLADAESVLYDRIRRTISEPRPLIFGFDQDAWAANLGYDELPLSVSRSVYVSAREGVIVQARRCYESHGSREYVHNEVGLRTLKQEIDKVADHNEHHLAHIEQALNG